MGSTIKDLPVDLEEYLDTKPVTTARRFKITDMKKRALKGIYHDFLSPYGTPKIKLHMDLVALNLPELDTKMQNGDYDDESPTDKI